MKSKRDQQKKYIVNGQNKNIELFLLLLPFNVFVNVCTVSASVKVECKWVLKRSKIAYFSFFHIESLQMLFVTVYLFTFIEWTPMTQPYVFLECVYKACGSRLLLKIILMKILQGGRNWFLDFLISSDFWWFLVISSDFQ